ncbi:MAG TPA: hypothetical protein PKW95_18970 [bacterium]|nr:hypothetical protein [bacterium]
MKKRNGFTIVDILFWLIILILIGQAAARIDDVYQTHYRFLCYENHTALDKLLWNVCSEQQREVWDVLSAYPVLYPDGRPAQLVVIFKPRVDEYERQIVIEPLHRWGPIESPVCPLDHRTPATSSINYMFYGGKWHCMYNKYHSE